jgi:hypothetical protein
MQRIHLRRLLVPAAVAVALGAGAPAAFAADSLTPSAVAVTLAPGQSTTINKQLHLDKAPPKADIEIAIDHTGSMTQTIAQAKADASSLVSAVQGQIADARFAVVAFEDKTEGPKEYQLLAPMTTSAAAVQSAINGLAADAGGDAPEAHNLVFHNAYSDPAIGFRASARKFVVVLSDAEPHAAGTFAALQPGCKDATNDPNALSTTTELAGMKAAELTLFMVRQVGPLTSSSLQCYQQIAAQGFTGGAGVDGGANLGPQIVSLINSAVQSINKVELATVPASFSSWASFNPASPYGPVTAPLDKSFVETITVPAGTPGGDYAFDVVASADGATRATEHVTVHVPVPKLSVNNVTVTEGNSGLTPATFTVSMDKASPVPVTVKYATANGSATAPADYQAAAGTLTFAPGQTQKPVTVNVVGDLVDEPNETFHLALSAPSGATIADGDGLGKILDDDRSGAFTCRAAGLRLLGAEVAVSNGPGAPCKDASAAPLNLPLGLGTVTVGANLISSATNQTPDDLTTTPALDDRGEADAKAAVVTLLAGATTVKATVATSHAEARCSAPLGGTPVLGGSSVLTGLTVNGQSVAVDTGELKINLLLGVLHINSTQKTATGVTQRAIWFENTLLPSSLDVVVAEAKAGFSGNPCV